MHYEQAYVPPTLTVDAVLFQLVDSQLMVLLTRRAEEPFKGAWALPGGYCAEGQTTIEALTSIVKRKVGVDIDIDLGYIEQLYTFDTVARDPRGHAVSVTYMGCGKHIATKGGSQTSEWHPADQLPALAYDHADIIAYARDRLTAKLTYTNAAMGLLNQKFTLSQLQTAYEAVLGRELDKRNFRKKFLSLHLIHETSEILKSGAHRPAKLYEFNNNSLETLDRSFD
ncbi:MAG TPA: NUDIX domain-containing protein [Patescibacteria group bacterium]|nr:NUDIX domain-containing protein [Patescibacteria group bacterium]